MVSALFRYHFLFVYHFDGFTQHDVIFQAGFILFNNNGLAALNFDNDAFRRLKIKGLKA